MNRLIFKYGTMNSGKTADLLIREHSYNKLRNKFKTFLFKPEMDTRSKTIKSRIGIEKEAILLGKEQLLSNVLEDLMNFKETLDVIEKQIIVLVDEVQFLTEEQIMDIVELYKKKDVIIFCYGLMRNYKNEIFPSSDLLTEYATNIKEIQSFCECGNLARTHLLKQNGQYVLQGDGIFVGDTEYSSVCFDCYENVRLQSKRRYNDCNN